MSKTEPHLQRREGFFYFRMKVPAALRPYVGRAELRKSLGTTDLIEAQKRLKRARREAEELFAEARRTQPDRLMEATAALQTGPGVRREAPANHFGYWSFIEFAVERAGHLFPELDTDAMRLRLVLHRLARLSLYDSVATVHRKYNWSPAGYGLLFVLMITGSIELHRAATLAGMSRAAVSAVVRTLERDGLVKRRVSSADQRNILVDLTAAGRAAIKSGFLTHHENERAWSARLTAAERTELIRLLTKLASSHSEPSFEPPG